MLAVIFEASPQRSNVGECGISGKGIPNFF
jgi:hypothetical protein